MSKYANIKRWRDIKQLERELYEERRFIEKQVEQENATLLLDSGDLQRVKWRLTEGGRNLIAVDSTGVFNKYYTDTSFSSNLEITDDVGLFADFDDRKYFLSATSVEHLVDFAVTHKLEIWTDQIQNKINELSAEIETLKTLLDSVKDML